MNRFTVKALLIFILEAFTGIYFDPTGKFFLSPIINEGWRKMMKRWPLFVVASLALISVIAAATRAQRQETNLPEIIRKVGANQDRSLAVRDHSRYEQSLKLERFEIKDGGEQIKAIRNTVAIVEPSRAPDKTGRIEVITRVISDTDDKGRPKKKVAPDVRTGLASGAFLDLFFFPLLPEKLPKYDFREVVTNRPGERAFRFAPKPTAVDVPLASGIAHVDAKTGEVLILEISGLYNLETLDKMLKGLRSFNAKVAFSQFNNQYRFPTYAEGSGVSDISRFKGNFRFAFEESKYQLVSIN